MGLFTKNATREDERSAMYPTTEMLVMRRDFVEKSIQALKDEKKTIDVCLLELDIELKAIKALMEFRNVVTDKTSILPPEPPSFYQDKV